MELVAMASFQPMMDLHPLGFLETKTKRKKKMMKRIGKKEEQRMKRMKEKVGRSLGGL